AQLAAKSSPNAGTQAPQAAPTPAPTAAPPVAATPAPVPAEQPPAKAEAAPPAPVAQEPPPAAEPASAPPVTAKLPAPKPQPAATTESGGGSILDTLKDFWWAIALVLVALAGLIGLRAWRSRRQSEFDDSLGRLAVAGANSMDDGFGTGDTAPVRPLS